MGNCNYAPANECDCRNTAAARPTPYMQSRSNSMRSPGTPRPCNRPSDPLAGLPVGMAYVPWQFFQEVYEPDKAIQCGTIFPELSKPFYGKGGCPR